MKKLVFIVMIFLLVNLFAIDIEERLQKFGETNGKTYIQPLVTAFGTNLNSGLFNTAKTLKPFTFGLHVNTMLAFVPDEDKTFLPTKPDLEHPATGIDLYEEPQDETATIFGENGILIEHNSELDDMASPSYIPNADELDIQMPNGLNLSAMPFAIPQFNLGFPGGNEIMFRGFPKTKINDDIGDIGFWGFGLKHSIDQYFPKIIPVDIAIQSSYQNLFVGDIISLKNFNANVEVSKKLLMWTLYSGIGFDKTTLTADYTYTYETLNENGNIKEVEQSIKFDIEGENDIRATVGIRYSLLLLKVFADYTFSRYQVLNFGFGISF